MDFSTPQLFIQSLIDETFQNFDWQNVPEYHGLPLLSKKDCDILKMWIERFYKEPVFNLSAIFSDLREEEKPQIENILKRGIGCLRPNVKDVNQSELSLRHHIWQLGLCSTLFTYFKPIPPLSRMGSLFFSKPASVFSLDVHQLENDMVFIKYQFQKNIDAKLNEIINKRARYSGKSNQ